MSYNQVKEQGQPTIDKLENAIRQRAVSGGEVESYIATWQTNQGNFRRAQDFDAARACGEIIEALQGIKERL